MIISAVVQAKDQFFGGPGADVLQGGPDADYFDCGLGIDKIIDFDASQGDIKVLNCEK